MRHAITVSLVFAAVVAVGCQRKDKPPQPVVSVLPFVSQMVRMA